MTPMTRANTMVTAIGSQRDSPGLVNTFLAVAGDPILACPMLSLVQVSRRWAETIFHLLGKPGGAYNGRLNSLAAKCARKHTFWPKRALRPRAILCQH